MSEEETTEDEEMETFYEALSDEDEADMKEDLREEREDQFPTSPPKDSVMRFLRDILGLSGPNNKDQILKTGNLSSAELGRPVTPVRTYADTGDYAAIEGFPGVANFIYGKQNNTLMSSLSLKGFFPKLGITQKRVRSLDQAPTTEVKKGVFGQTITSKGGEEI